MTDFTGKTAAVTGSSGIGLGAALLLARSGARVFLAGIDAGLNNEAAALAAGEGLDMTLHQVDVADEDSVPAGPGRSPVKPMSCTRWSMRPASRPTAPSRIPARRTGTIAWR